jgi:hypothetical protein
MVHHLASSEVEVSRIQSLQSHSCMSTSTIDYLDKSFRHFCRTCRERPDRNDSLLRRHSCVYITRSTFQANPTPPHRLRVQYALTPGFQSPSPSRTTARVNHVRRKHHSTIHLPSHRRKPSANTYRHTNGTNRSRRRCGGPYGSPIQHP